MRGAAWDPAAELVQAKADPSAELLWSPDAELRIGRQPVVSPRHWQSTRAKLYGLLAAVAGEQTEYWEIGNRSDAPFARQELTEEELKALEARLESGVRNRDGTAQLVTARGLAKETAAASTQA
ncbi:hypothetical protein [Streptomyces wedmorensis]